MDYSDYTTACTNCGESNYHVENNISFITGQPGFHVCHSCGYNARQFPKIARQEIILIKERFLKKPKYFFKNESVNSRGYFLILSLLAILLGLIVTLRV